MGLYRISFRDKYRREIKSSMVIAPIEEIAFEIARPMGMKIKGCKDMVSTPIPTIESEELAYVN